MWEEAGGLFPRCFMEYLPIPEISLSESEAAREHGFKPPSLQIFVRIVLGRPTPIQSAVPSLALFFVIMTESVTVCSSGSYPKLDSFMCHASIGTSMLVRRRLCRGVCSAGLGVPSSFMEHLLIVIPEEDLRNPKVEWTNAASFHLLNCLRL